MSFEENVERLKAAYAAIGRGELEPATEMMDPEVELHSVFAAAEGKIYRGLGGFRQWYADMVEVWEEFDIEPYEFHDLGDRILLVSRQRMRGRGSGVSLDRDVATIWTLRDDKGRRADIYFDVDEARHAAGLSSAT